VSVPAQPLVRDVLLRDGSTLRLRAPGPDDLDDLKAFYGRLSPESRYLRFHGYGRVDLAAADYANADGDDRVALIGRQGDRVVAAAGYDVLREPGAAEVAFAVADEFQGRGAATRLLEQLAAIAAERAIHRFDAEVMQGNQGMLSVFERAGFGVRRKSAYGELTVSLDISPDEAVLERIDARDHRGVVASLRPILAPASLAVVGASSAPGNLGGAVLRNILDGGFQGVATPVNRVGRVVRSIRVARSLADLDEPPELVVIAVPPDDVPDVASQAAECGAKALLILTAGFADRGDEGRELEERVLEIVRGAGLRMVGPNCLGVLNTDPAVSLNATFAGARVPAGHLAICSQSGAIGIGLLGHAAGRRLGVASFASLGDNADVSTYDLLELWEEDPRTHTVMLYVETFGNPERFARVAQRVSRRKPILAIKGRRRPDGERSEAQTHSAAALRRDDVVDALLHHAGILRFTSGDELFNAAEFFAAQPLPGGRRVGIVSNSTGMATLAADACATLGLLVGRVDGPARNPLVLGIRAGAADYTDGIRTMLADAGIDAVMAYYVDLARGDPQAVLDAVSDAAAGQRKPLVASVVTADGSLPTDGPVGMPNFQFPESCAAVLARGAERREWLSRPMGRQPSYDDLDPAAARALIAARLDGDGASWLGTAEGAALMATHGIATVESHHCADVERAVGVVQEIAGPIALKADFPPPARAGDVDAVLLDLAGEAAVRAGWRELERRMQAAGRPWTGAVVQPLAAPGADVLVGTVRDPDFGPVMAVGLSGRLAGLARTVAFRVLPVTVAEADELIDASESVATLLDGFRGSPQVDREALRELILRFARLLGEVPEVAEADLNPVRCMPEGYVILDMRVRVERLRPAERVKTW
jgi:acyl-CoA synthetase (NDP forming)/RimJ/RimL family protein N-acetyltransferase